MAEAPPSRKKVLLLSQVFYPDVVAVAQHLTDLGVALAAQGNTVTALSARRAYDSPEKSFPAEETYAGVHIRRIPTLALGKKTKLRRIISFASFFFSASVPLLTLPRQDVIVVLSSPPLLSVLASVFVKLRGVRLIYWVMDLNPDEAIAAGWMSSSSLPARVLEKLSRFSLRSSSAIVVLDRFMQERILRKGMPAERVYIIPPWPHEDEVAFDPAGRLANRAAMGWQDKFVVLYAGNHSPLHPVDTLLQAALRLRDNPTILFVFSGGGSELPRIRQFAQDNALSNIHVQGYCPLEQLAALLSSADLQVVLLGDPFVGIVHPCKIYNMLAIGKPVLYIGPAESHIADMNQNNDPVCVSARHGEIDRVVDLIQQAAAASEPTTHHSAAHPALQQFSQKSLMRQMIELVTTAE